MKGGVGRSRPDPCLRSGERTGYPAPRKRGAIRGEGDRQPRARFRPTRASASSPTRTPAARRRDAESIAPSRAASAAAAARLTFPNGSPLPLGYRASLAAGRIGRYGCGHTGTVSDRWIRPSRPAGLGHQPGGGIRPAAPRPQSPGPSDAEPGDGRGGGPPRPRRPPNPPWGGTPLEDAQPARVRLRNHDRLSALLPERRRFVDGLVLLERELWPAGHRLFSTVGLRFDRC